MASKCGTPEPAERKSENWITVWPTFGPTGHSRLGYWFSSLLNTASVSFRLTLSLFLFLSAVGENRGSFTGSGRSRENPNVQIHSNRDGSDYVSFEVSMGALSIRIFKEEIIRLRFFMFSTSPNHKNRYDKKHLKNVWRVKYLLFFIYFSLWTFILFRLIYLQFIVIIILYHIFFFKCKNALYW